MPWTDRLAIIREDNAFRFGKDALPPTKGAALWAERARDELGRAKSETPPKPTLTPAERRIAELATSGMTNRDVAATLYISLKTVEANLTQIYRKLGIRSRAQLAAKLASGEL